MLERADALWTQVEALIGLYRAIDRKVALPPLRGWAMSPDLLLYIFQHICQYESRSIIECGSGSSTIVMAHALENRTDDSHIFALEHIPSIAAGLRKELHRRGLSRFVTVIDASLTERRYPGFDQIFRWYDTNTASLPSYADLLVVDGPPGNTNSYARYPAGPELLPLLIPSAHIILDDTNRPEESQLPNLWLSLYPDLKSAKLPVEKGALKLWFSDDT